MISVVMCAKDMENTIIQSVESLCVGEPDAEIILVDDGSEDNTPIIMDVFAKEVPHITVVHLATNEGLLRARKAGFLASHGEYVAFMDADDEISPGYYSALAKVCPDGGIAIGNAIQSYMQLSAPESFSLDDLKDKEHALAVTYMWNKIFSRDVAEKVFGDWDPPYMVHLEDTVIMSKALAMCRDVAKSNVGAYRQPLPTRRDVPSGEDRLPYYTVAYWQMSRYLPRKDVEAILGVRLVWDGIHVTPDLLKSILDKWCPDNPVY